MANIYKNTKTDLTSASATTVYTVPSDSRSIVKSILVNDDSGSGDTITLTLTNAAGTVFSLFKVKAVAANATGIINKSINYDGKRDIKGYPCNWKQIAYCDINARNE